MKVIRKIEIKSLVSVFKVSNIEQSVAWYKSWLGEPDVIPMNGVAEYQLSSNSWLQLSCEEKDRIEKSSIVVGVEDINQTKKTLDECGIKTSEIIDYEVVLVFDVFDIDGNKITFAKEV